MGQASVQDQPHGGTMGGHLSLPATGSHFGIDSGGRGGGGSGGGGEPKIMQQSIRQVKNISSIMGSDKGGGGGRFGASRGGFASNMLPSFGGGMLSQGHHGGNRGPSPYTRDRQQQCVPSRPK